MAKVIFVVFDEAGNYAADILFSGRMDAAKFSFAGNGQD
ncbi:prophage PssSM-03, partial [Pseudomonas syringae pv. persicae]